MNLFSVFVNKAHLKLTLYNFLAFCENDRHLLCITCILEDGYKNHEISSVEDVSVCVGGVSEIKFLESTNKLFSVYV